MDYHSMKRKELQALCKKHKIPANSANSVLADKLSQLLNERQIPITQQRNCLKSPVETADECEPGVSRRQAKKVRFSPTNEVVEYELRNGKKQMVMATEKRAQRKSVAKKVDKSVVDNVKITADLVDNGVQAPVKLTRSSVQLLEKDGVVLNNGKKQGRRAVEHVEKGIDSVKETEGNLGRVTRLRVQTMGEHGAIQVDENKQSKRSRKDFEIAGESVEEAVVAQVRVTRSKTQDVNLQVKKKRGRVAKDVKNVEPPMEIMDIPVRVMRSRSTIANPRVEKKRTRREMKATDLSDNLSSVAPEEKQVPSKRKSLRTKGIEVVGELVDDIVDVINVSRATRSKAPGMKPSGRNTRSIAENKVEVQRKSKRVQQLGEPLEHAGKKIVSRRKSVMQPGKIEEILRFEEPVNRPATRRKSMMQKALGKEIDKPLVGKSKSVKETNIAESPTVGKRKTVGRKQSKGQSNNPSMIEEGLADTENVIKQVKDASENEMEAVANATGSPKSRKRSGDPIIEDQILETEYVSPVDASSRCSRRSNSRSQGKAVTYSPHSSVAKKQPESILKTRASNGAIIRDRSSKKRANLSRTKINESEDHAEKSNTVGIPVLKSVNFDLDEKVTDTKRIPGNVGSNSRFSCRATISDWKEPSQSAIKKQPVGDAQLSLHKVTKFTHDPAVNTAPGRVTRSGIKHGGNAAISFSEKLSRTKLSESGDHAEKYNTEGIPVLKLVNFDLDEKVLETEHTPNIGGSYRWSTCSAIISDGKEPSQSTIKEQPIGDAQLSSHRIMVTKFRHDPAVNTAPSRVTRSGIKHGGNVSVSFSERVDRKKQLSRSVHNKCVSNHHKASSSPIHLMSFKQSDDKIKSKEVETPVDSLTEDIGYSQIKKESEQDVSTCNDSLLNYSDKHDASNNSEHDDEDERASTQMQVMNEPVSEDNQPFDMDNRDGAEYLVDAGKELAKEPEFEGGPSTNNDVHEIPMLRKSDGGPSTGNDVHEIPMLRKSDGGDGSENATKECGTDSMPLSGDNMPSDGEDLALNGDDAEDEAFNANREHESNLTSLTDDDSDTAVFGKDDDFNISRLFEPTSESTSSDDMIETPFSGNDTYGESDNAVDNQKPHLKPLTGNDDVQDEVKILPKELETGLETSYANSGLEVPVAGNDVDVDPVMDDRSDGQDRESDHELLTSNATSFMDEQYVGCAGLVPASNENMPVVTEVLTRSSDLEPELMSNVTVGKVSCDTNGVCTPVGHSTSTMSIEALLTPTVTTITVDACEESIPDINKDAQIFGSIYGLENAQRVTDTENDSLSELKVKGISEPDEGDPPKGSGIPSPDMSIKQITEETEVKTVNDHAPTDKKEYTLSTIDHDLDSGKFVEDFPNNGVDQLVLLGDIKAHENPTTEEFSGQLMGDFGGHGRLFAKESLSITYGKEESHVDDTHLDLPTSVKDDDQNKQDDTQKASTSTDWGNYGFVMNEFHNPVIANENDDLLADQVSGLQTSARASSSIKGNYSPAAEFVNSEKLEQGSRNVVDREIFNWPDSSLKALFTKPATTPSSRLKEGEQDAVCFDFPDGSPSEYIGRKGTPAFVSNHHRESESARAFNSFSLETLFTTPASTRITYVNDDQMENESSKVFNGKTQVTETQGQENVMNRVPNYENFYNKYFGDEEVDGSSDMSEEFKGDQYDLSCEAARTGHLEASGLKDTSIGGGMSEKKQD